MCSYDITSTWSDETRAAYLACAFDTDGWITLIHNKPRPHRSGRIYPNIGVTNVNIDFLQRLIKITDAKAAFTTNDRAGMDGRGIVANSACYQITWRSPLVVIPVLELALPYLVVKRKQAEFVLEFARSRMSVNGHVIRGGKPYDARSWELVRLVRNANGRYKI